MNIFIYDVFLDKYKKRVKNIEKTLNKLSLQGKILYLRDIKNLQESIIKEINNGAKTIIAVGNNKTLNNIVNILANISEKIPLSIIPIGPENSIANSFGITDEKSACYVLSGRRIENIKLALANDVLFINNIFIKNKDTTLYINNSYKIIPQKKGSCFIYNLPPQKQIFNNIKIDPKDNILNLYIETKPKSKTHLLVEKIEIKNEQETAILDDIIKVQPPIKIESSNKIISFIVGKDRLF